jgi:protein-L-isoaspartate O-methyltransferase
VRAALPNGGGRLLELHCGFGHSTAALAPLFAAVVAVEWDRALAAAAEANLAVHPESSPPSQPD